MAGGVNGNSDGSVPHFWEKTRGECSDLSGYFVVNTLIANDDLMMSIRKRNERGPRIRVESFATRY